MRSVSVAGGIERPGYAWLGIGLQLFVAVMALPVGFMMIVDANGSPLGASRTTGSPIRPSHRSLSLASSCCW